MSALVGTRFGAYLQLAWFAGSRYRELGRPLLRQQLQLQIQGAGVNALPVIVAMAVLTGAATATQVAALIGADSDLTQRMLFLGLFFELAPLLSALVVVARSSAGIASELAVMNLHDEFTALRRLGVPTRDDIQQLFQQVDRLSQNIQELTRAAEADAKDKKARIIKAAGSAVTRIAEPVA